MEVKDTVKVHKLSPGERVALERNIQQRMATNVEYKSHVERKLAETNNEITTNKLS